ncbi:MAG: hypothetical protein R3F59_10355 [Myxococcota bacterium]
MTSGAQSAVIYVLFMDNREQIDEERYDIWMQRSLDLGATWLPAPVKVNHGDASNVWAPDLYCNETGVFVVWEDDRDGELQNHQVYFNASTDQGETFLEDDVLLEDDPEGDTMSLGPKIDGYGTSLFVTWYDNTNNAYDILVNKSSNGGGEWDNKPTRIDSDIQGTAYSARPQLAVGNSGNDVWVTWEDSRDGKADIYLATAPTAAPPSSRTSASTRATPTARTTPSSPRSAPRATTSTSCGTTRATARAATST